MEKLWQIDWESVFVPTESLLEIVLRGTILYIVMFAFLRIFRRQSGSISTADLLVVVIIADAAQNGMIGDGKSVTEAVLLITTFFLWNYLFDWLGYRFKFFEKLLEPDKLQMVKNGKFLRRNMRKEMITKDELESQMRQNGIEDISELKSAYMESDGNFSFIKKEGENEPSGSKKSVPR